MEYDTPVRVLARDFDEGYAEVTAQSWDKSVNLSVTNFDFDGLTLSPSEAETLGKLLIEAASL